MAPPMSMPVTAPAIPHDALVQQKQGQAIMIWTIGASVFCRLLYDEHLEINARQILHLWLGMACVLTKRVPENLEKAKKYFQRPLYTFVLSMSIMAFLSLIEVDPTVNRYFGILQLVFVVTLNANAWSPAACKHVFYFEPVGALVSTVLSQVILGSRVYAIFAQNKAVGVILATTLAAEIVIGGISISTTHPPPVIPNGASPGARPPCSAVTGPFGWLVAFWSIPLLFDTLTFSFTAWKAYKFWKAEVNTPLFDVIWRDGLLYFFGVFSMNLANVIIFLTVPKALRAVNLSATLVLEVVLSCRLILNLRGAHGLSVPNSQASQAKDITSKSSRVPMIRVHTTSSVEHDGVAPVESSSVSLEVVGNVKGDKNASYTELKGRPS